ncbi:hypothetical protein HB364_32140 [Pseudoflavitalea sp. X16]|uniref:hypothetical protein n=1 Tax=Paraflavitalea devenefica TaxID=2716334 RepID=UPI00141F4644|nr:hypothetical protein [Paraflavitalea devenefica]NII29773.1 hypothetical protein [Paraflavitalea devenefica]
MLPEAYYIAKCKEIIEQKLAWGKHDTWQSQDFENLSEKIFEETKVMLSSSTLKRIWGKVRYDSIPNRATLDALAQFIGYKNWREFKSAVSETVGEQDAGTPSKGQEGDSSSKERSVKGTAPVRMPFKILLAVIVTAALLVFVGLKIKEQPTNHLWYKEVLFSGKPVTSGLPNTVIFNYDASHSNADSVFIQQSWDPRKRFKVDKQLHEYTTTYYYPGYYKAKLILNDSIVKEQDVYIETNGWVGIIEKAPVPVYLPSALFTRQLGITKAQLSALQIDFQSAAPIFSLTKMDKGITVNSSNLLFEVQLQNTYDESNAICQYTNVRIMGTNGVIDVPLCKPGCVGEVGLMLGMQYIDGKTHDLSGFGVDFSKKVKLNCATRDKHITLSIDDKVVYRGDLKDDMGKVVGIQIKFNGTGVVSHLEIKQNKYHHQPAS